MVEPKECLVWQAQAMHGISLSAERAAEIAAQVNAFNESVRSYADRLRFEDEPAGFTRALADLDTEEGGA